VIIVSHDEETVSGGAELYRFNEGRAENLAAEPNAPRLVREAVHG
jgi:hypothetical protein